MAAVPHASSAFGTDDSVDDPQLQTISSAATSNYVHVGMQYQVLQVPVKIESSAVPAQEPVINSINEPRNEEVSRSPAL